MFVRSSTFDADPAMLDMGAAYMRDTIMPAMSHIPGCLGVSLMMDRQSGHCITASAWQSDDAMRDSAELVRPIRDSAVHTFAGDSMASIEHWQIAVMHRAHFAKAGTCMRATWLRLPAGQMDGALDAFKFGILTRIEDLPGFCSASLLTQPERGRAVITVGYDDRAAMVASREAGATLRDEALSQVGAAMTAMGEYELALAHLHVPELV